MYVQVCYLLASDQTLEREFSPLQAIRDNWPKLILSLDEVNRSTLGIEHRNLQQWLLQPDVWSLSIDTFTIEETQAIEVKCATPSGCRQWGSTQPFILPHWFWKPIKDSNSNRLRSPFGDNRHPTPHTEQHPFSIRQKYQIFFCRIVNFHLKLPSLEQNFSTSLIYCDLSGSLYDDHLNLLLAS